MKEIKDFLEELQQLAKPSSNGSVVKFEDAVRIMTQAYVEGINFQDAQKKQSDGRVQSKG